ncbi:MAG: anthranilate synthase component I family protein, partial [Bdellovibrionales bacterium]|nr:anthranilate synthase component I family protein [Bdellovibrionales bacterium]
MMALLEKTTISQVVQRKVAANESFLDLAKRYAATPGTVVLCSGGEFDSVNSHFLAIHPWLFCEGDRERLSLSVHGETEQTTGCPWQFLEEIHKAFTFTFPVEKTNVASGLFGYLSYELKDYTETLLRTTVDDLHLPLFYFTSPLFVVEQRVEEEFLIISTPCFSHEKEVDALQRIDTLCEQWKEKPPARSPFMATSPYRSCFSKEEYLEAVSKVRSYIRDGDIYQANLSQRFSCSFSGDPFDLFHKLFEENPAPFFSYLNCGSHQIVSSSPERFLSQQGCFLESRPIKGTMPRGFSEQEDVEKKNALLESGKNSAELSMIVDLIRNDLGKVSQTGTVEVVSHKALESYSNVHHLVSVVQGKKRDEVSSVNTLRALFPGGSITGCPKIRAMEIIDEFESVVRHVYTGAIGYLSFHDTMDFSIAIRTAIVKENKL